MSVTKKENKDFSFSKENLSLAKCEINKYPKGREGSAIISILWLAQKQNKGWISPEIIDYVAQFLDLPKIRVMEIATFYSMFNLSPVGAHHFQMCGTTPCMLSGSGELKNLLHEEIGDQNYVSKDNLSWVEVECLGACCNAPIIQINDDYYEDLNVNDLKNIIDDLRKGKEIKSGSYKDRLTSAPLDKNIRMFTQDEIEKISKGRKKPGLEA
ncbi:NADH-quinone oxidoreductase subunit NuoE [Gammaproteobacteria bacterium]|nr:NADH-quinone oxidoreductase subunit E [Rhodobiaceae bacterium]MDC3085040.1 NADH-quinone oxidoreductase subunit NuoE [Gammaproteobacteria bacterium]OUT82978.1 MAG: hypothetical protein CBB88_03150 [Rhizobiales bacterium TMED28]RZO33501.1 MAG: NADH-quinone oxidoreductase subunit E [Hyphomicrobiales bacterium]